MTFKIFKWVLVIVAFHISASNLYAGVEEDYNAGLAAEESYKFAEANTYYKKAAEKGYAPAQYKMGEISGHIYDNKEDDLKHKAKWYTKAAEQGYVDAQIDLATMYFNNEITSKDSDGIVDWINNLFRLEGSKNRIEALKWHTKAAEHGDAKGQFAMGLVFYQGNFVSQDYKEAFSWITKAAEQGYTHAQETLEEMYRKGLGVSQDPIAADKWGKILLAKRRERAKENSKEWGMGNYNTGMAYYEDGDYSEALRFFKIALVSANGDHPALQAEIEAAEKRALRALNKKTEKKSLNKLVKEEPYTDNRKTLVALATVKSDSEWSRSTADNNVGVSVRTIIVESKCYPYVQVGVNTIFPVAKTIINANGTNLHVVGIGMGHKLTSIGFVGKNVAGRQYLMTEFKSKNAVNFDIDDKSYTISANGFTKGLQATIATCNDRAKKLSKTL